MGALVRDDMAAMLGMGGEGHVLRHTHAGLVRAGNHRDWDARGNVAAGDFSRADGQSLDVAGHDEEKFGVAPTFADKANGFRWKLGQLAENALYRVTGGGTE